MDGRKWFGFNQRRERKAMNRKRRMNRIEYKRRIKL
jgi:hypothetical protein